MPITQKANLYIIFVFCLALFSSCKNVNQPNDGVDTRYLNIADSNGYVGKEVCKECHAGIYQTFIQTGMGKSIGLATKRKSAGNFNKDVMVHDTFLGFYYKPYWEGDSFRILEYKLRHKDTIYKRKETVKYIIGSGQHTNSHLMETNGYITQMPLTFYTQRQQWDLPPGFENGFNTRFGRQIGLECMSCHNAIPGFVPGAENKFDDVPNGINCERCHGPGRIHVALKRKGVLVDTAKEIDFSIVNPKKLSLERQFDICQRCHLQGNTVLKPGKSYVDYRPGMRLADVMTVFLPKYEGVKNEFIMASHVDRMKMSKCFKAGITCVTCHNPHVSVKETSILHFNQICMGCHNQSKKQLIPDSIKCKTNCTDCHMPKSGSIDIPHVRITDHWIQLPVQLQNLKGKEKKFVGLTPINEKRVASNIMALAYLQQFEKFEPEHSYLLDSAYEYIKRIPDDNKTLKLNEMVHFHFLKKNYQAINELIKSEGAESFINQFKKWSDNNNKAWTFYRIGEAFYQLGDFSSSLMFLENATQFAPNNVAFKNKLGAVLFANGKLQEAKLLFEQMIRAYPKDAMSYCNLGYVYFVQNKFDLAMTHFDLALKLDPNYEKAVVNKYLLLEKMNQLKQAQKMLKDFLIDHPNAHDLKQLIKH